MTLVYQFDMGIQQHHAKHMLPGPEFPAGQQHKSSWHLRRAEPRTWYFGTTLRAGLALAGTPRPVLDTALQEREYIEMFPDTGQLSKVFKTSLRRNDWKNAEVFGLEQRIIEQTQTGRGH